MGLLNLTAKLTDNSKTLSKYNVKDKNFLFNILTSLYPDVDIGKNYSSNTTLYYCNACSVPMNISSEHKLCPVCGTSNDVVTMTVDTCKQMLSSLREALKNITTTPVVETVETVEAVPIQPVRTRAEQILDDYIQNQQVRYSSAA